MRNAKFAATFRPDPNNGGLDYVSRDGKIRLELKRGTIGIRDLHAAAIHIALDAVERDFAKGCLVVLPERTTVDRIIHEWRQVQSLFRPQIASRLAVIAIGPDRTAVEPNDPKLAQVADIIVEALRTGSADPKANVQRAPRTSKVDEIFKILLVRWLRREPRIQISELARHVGCSVMTALVAIRLWSARRILKRVPNRPIGLESFPVDKWNELVAKERTAGDVWRFIDTSGQPRSPESLVKRLAKLNVTGLAVGGVVAARYWCPDLDLHGTPRLDLTLHTPDMTADFGFIGRLDPALRLAEPSEETTPLVVIHPLRRAEPLFESFPRAELPVADPVETVLHLENLRLPVQARQVLTHLRPELRVL